MHLVVSGHFHALDALCPWIEPRYPWKGGQVVPEPDVLEKRKDSWICRKSNPTSSMAYLLTLYIIPALTVQLCFHKFTFLAAETIVTQNYNNFM